MALRALKQLTQDDTTADIIVPRLVDDHRYAAADNLLTEFRRCHERLEHERDRLILKHHFGDRPFGDGGPNDKALWARLLEREAEAAPANEPPAAAAGAPDAVLAGMEILRGATIEPLPDHASRMRENDRNIMAMRSAIDAQTVIVGEIAAELTMEYSLRLRPAWNALQLELYRAAQALARTTRRVRELRAAIVAAGIGSRSDVLAMPAVRSPLILGDETDWHSEIAQWRRILEGLGILP